MAVAGLFVEHRNEIDNLERDSSAWHKNRVNGGCNLTVQRSQSPSSGNLSFSLCTIDKSIPLFETRPKLCSAAGLLPTTFSRLRAYCFVLRHPLFSELFQISFLFVTPWLSKTYISFLKSEPLKSETTSFKKEPCYRVSCPSNHLLYAPLMPKYVNTLDCYFLRWCYFRYRFIVDYTITFRAYSRGYVLSRTTTCGYTTIATNYNCGIRLVETTNGIFLDFLKASYKKDSNATMILVF